MLEKLNAEELAQLNAVLGDGNIEAASLREEKAIDLDELVAEEQAATLMASTIKESGGTVGDVTKGIISMALFAVTATGCVSSYTRPPGRHTNPPPRSSVMVNTKTAYANPPSDPVNPSPSPAPKPSPEPTPPFPRDPVDPIPPIGPRFAV